MTDEEFKEFCDKAIEPSVTINDILYTIMLMAQKQTLRMDEDG